jgi:predicted nucleic acid-binding protein
MGTIEEALKRLQGHKVYLDTNVFIYFLDRNPDYFQNTTNGSFRKLRKA